MYTVTTKKQNHLPAIPEGALFENVHLREWNSKSFLLKSGLHRKCISVGRMHWMSDEGWRDINLEMQDWKPGIWEIVEAPYIWRNTETGIGSVYKSREGGYARMRLIEIDGKPVRNDFIPVPDDNFLRYSDIDTDTDFAWQGRTGSVAGWLKLHSDSAPRKWTWEFIHHGDIGIAQNVRGMDANKMPLEILRSSKTEVMPNGLRRTVLTKEWTGRVSDRQHATRERVWHTNPTYPVIIDPDITERITTGNDDGFEAPGYTNWNGSINYPSMGYGAGYYYHTGLRFQTITNVDSGDTIDLSEVRFKTVGGGGGPNCYIEIYCGDEDDAAAFSTSNRPTTITKTTASFSTATSIYVDGWETRAVTSMVQEVVDRAGWASANDLSVLIMGKNTGGVHSIYTYDGYAGYRAFLYVDYTAGGGGGIIPQIMHHRRLQGVS